jgi:hypothetical protein
VVVLAKTLSQNIEKKIKKKKQPCCYEASSIAQKATSKREENKGPAKRKDGSRRKNEIRKEEEATGWSPWIPRHFGPSHSKTLEPRTILFSSRDLKAKDDSADGGQNPDGTVTARDEPLFIVGDGLEGTGPPR